MGDMRRRLLLPLVTALAIASLTGCQAGALAPDETGTSTPTTAPSDEASTSGEPIEEPVTLPPMPQLCGELDSPSTAAAADAAGFVPNAQEWQASGDSWSRDVALPEPALTCAWTPATAGDVFVVVDVFQVDDEQLDAWDESGEWASTTVGGHEVRSDQESGVDDFGTVGTTWAAAGDRLLRVTAIEAVATGTALAEALVPTVLG